MVEGTLEAVVEEITVVVAGAAEEDVAIKNSLMVWTLDILIYSSPMKNGKIYPVGKCVRCNRAMTGNSPSIRGLWRHVTREVK